jgi:hypothetical protein
LIPSSGGDDNRQHRRKAFSYGRVKDAKVDIQREQETANLERQEFEPLRARH